ncbi:serine hydrolase domain-containing protein [Cohnella thermotolerans]|uniref:serine hydrolase domain-containing protein n=1 Tax=Cohnella thermotolerans TaxID=329858 RepID=UPI00041C02B9|nr:serine hydrolase [Cohnella thermotolerans]
MEYASLAAAIAPLNLRSCLISRQGQLVFEHYRDSQTAAELAKINSCTKSVLSALLCIAMDRGLLPQPETRASVFFPQLAASPDSRKRDITLLHLLTMTAGFEWTEFGGRNSFPRMTRSPHWIDFVLEQPMADAPGTRMEYNSGVSQMLSAILAQATGMTTARFAERYLFGPLGIENYRWEVDPQGVHTGGFGLWLRPWDLLKFGELYLQSGKWENDQLISSELIARSVRPAVSSEPPRRGLYGWHWWVDSFSAAEGTSAPILEYFFARGFGGQFVYVVPRLDTVVVLTDDKHGNNRQKADVFRRWIAPLLAQQL